MATITTTSLADVGRYKQKEAVWFDDGREEQLLAYVQSQCSSKGKVLPSDILQLIDEFGMAHKYLMNVGAEKGRIVTSLIAEHNPDVMVELGGYIGYSTLLFADALRSNGGTRYISFERDPKFAGIAQAFVDLSGLSDIVRIVVGSSSKNLLAGNAGGLLTTVDMVFLDHYKPSYVRDVRICESLGLIHPGSVLAADNVISPGNPPYLEYVRSTPEEKRRALSEQEKAHTKHFPTATTNQYKQQYEEDDTELPGVPEIVYDSRLVHSHEPTGEPDGVEVTVCISVPV